MNPSSDSIIRWCQECKETVTTKDVDLMVAEAKRKVRVLNITLLNFRQSLSYEDDYNQDLAALTIAKLKKNKRT